LRAGLAASLAGLAVVALGSPAAAESLRELIPPLLQSHNLVKAAEADLEAASERTKASYGGWYPTLNVRSHYGYEHQNKPTLSNDTNMVTREADFSVTQLLWDFGTTNATIRGSELTREASRYALEAATQDLLLRAITAYLNVQRGTDVVGYARQSEDNIKKQTEIEDALVRRGAGLSTDVLNSKQQLAGAQARRAAAEGQIVQAKNGFRAVFQRDVDVGTMEKPVLPLDQLPPDSDEAVRIGLQENPALRRAATEVLVAREASARARAEGFFPRVNAVGETKFKEDVNGTVGSQNEQLGKVELNFPFNLGFTAINTLRASDQAAIAVERRLGETRDVVEQSTRDAWSRLETAQLRLDYLRNQANIAAEYLELARRERQLGTRTLNDILRAETDVINANSDAAAAETDVAIAAYTVLHTMGRLTTAAIAEGR
jgi:adhesin transport system outer membrane protein